MIRDNCRESKFDFLKENHFPEGQWNLGGAFRFDHAQLSLARFLREGMDSVITLSQVSGSPACLWSLDWHRQRSIANFNHIRQILNAYTQMGIDVSIEFDNPFISESHLSDTLGVSIAKEAMEPGGKGNISVSVASEKLADSLRARFPKLKLRAGVNFQLGMAKKRSAAVYNSLAETYERVALHPADNNKWQLLEALENKAKFEITLNDSCFRTCPVRREHMSALARLRENPYSADLFALRDRYLQMTGCRGIDSQKIVQKQSLHVTGSEWKQLYELGFRNFRIQGESLRNEITFIWEVCRALFGHDCDLSEKIALASVFYMAEMAVVPPLLPSGMGGYSSMPME